MHLVKKTLSLLVSLAMLLALLPLAALPAAADGPTTEWSDNKAASFSNINETAKTITITSAAELALLASNVNGGNNYSGWTITLAADLDLSAHKWTPIGYYYHDGHMFIYEARSFAGTFDGQGHTISGLNATTAVGNHTEVDIGLFGFVCDGGAVNNLTVSGNVTLTTKDTKNSYHVGGIVGCLGLAKNIAGSMQNCRSAVNVTVNAEPEETGYNFNFDIGGVAGFVRGGSMENCCSTGDVKATFTNASTRTEISIGGVTGTVFGDSLVNTCYSTGAVTVNVTGRASMCYTGGAVGAITADGEVTDCYSTGAVTANAADGADYGCGTGGFAGYINHGAVTNCYYRADPALRGVGDGTDTTTALTAAQFLNAGSFTDWDFTNTWYMGANGPDLRDFATIVSTWTGLYNALRAGGGIVLGADVTWHSGDQEELDIPKDVSAVLDLNGHTVDRASTSSNGKLFEVAGALTLTDCSAAGTGKLTGSNRPSHGGAVLVCEDGSFTMNGGTITGNKAVGQGGAVSVDNGGSFTMNGGTISGNTAQIGSGDAEGGGVCVANGGSFTMTGGTITANTVEAPKGNARGGGVAVGSTATFRVSGNATITGNTANGAVNNLFLFGKTVGIAGPLTGSIGISMKTPGVFTDGLPDKGTMANFTSDDTVYHHLELNTNGEALLAVNQFTVADLSAQTYDGKDKTPVPTVKDSYDGSKALTPGTDYTVSYQKGGEAVTEMVSAGDDYTVTVTGKGSYSLAEPVTKTFTIDPAAWAGNTASVTVKRGNSGEVDLAPCIAEAADVLGAPAAETDDGAVYHVALDTAAKKLTFDVKNDAAAGERTVTVPVTSKNYDYDSIAVTVCVIAKDTQTLTFGKSACTKTWGDEDFLYTATLSAGNGKVTYAVTSGADVAAVDAATGEVHILKAGTAVITATAAETDGFAGATASYTLTVERAAATVTADNKTKTVGEDDPELTWTVKGLVHGDTRDKLSVDIACEHGETAGTYAITPSGDKEQGNYTVTYVPGTLTITAARTPIVWDAPATYPPTIRESAHGTITISPKAPEASAAVTVTATPDGGYQLARLVITDTQGKRVPARYEGGSKWTFTQPAGKVAIEGVFAPIPAPLDPLPLVVSSPQTITVNGTEIKVEAYNIGGTNFFKLRDLAALLKGTPAQFNVEYDEARNVVVITTGKPYSGEAGTVFTDKSATAVLSPQSVEIDGREVRLTSVNIGGNNFFGLRELSAFLGYGVDYDEATNTAIIESK